MPKQKSVLIMVILFTLFVTSSVMAAPQYGGELRFGLHRDPMGFEPHISQGITNHSIQGNIYDTLIEYDENGGFRGALAENWEVLEDAVTYIFYLRQDVVFQDGKPFSAKDVIATFDRICDPDTNAAHYSEFIHLDYEAVDDYTVKVVVERPNATFLHMLASHTAYIVSADDIANGFNFLTDTNGTGPFILTSWEPQGEYVLERSPTYWKEGLPYLDRVVQMAIIDDGTRTNALRSGEVNLMEYVPWYELDLLELDFDVHLHYGAFNMIRIHLNQPPFDNKLVRQALNYVVDRQEILNLAYGGYGSVEDGPLQPEGSYFYYEELEQYYTKDHDKALSLLQEAGYDSPRDLPTIELNVAPIMVHSETAQIVQEQLMSFGIPIQWKTVDTPAMVAARTSGTYMLQQDGLSMTWPDPDYLRHNFHSEGSGYARGVGFKNSRLDEVLEAGLASVDSEERRELYFEAEQIILDEAPWIFLFWRPQAEATHPSVQGYEIIPGGLGNFNVNRFEYIWIDESIL